MFAGIYAVLDRGLTERPIELLDAVLEGGVRVVQYRAKAGVDRGLVRALHERTRAHDAILIVNDDLEAALEADGWHAGQEDLASIDVRDARARLGARAFGVSCGLPDEAAAAEAWGADYVGVGPFAATATKGDAGPAIGVTGVRAVVSATRLPVVAIGGIDAANLDLVAQSGASMAALASAFSRALDPAAFASDCVKRWAALTACA